MSIACNLLDLLQYSMLNAVVNRMGTMLCLNNCFIALFINDILG